MDLNNTIIPAINAQDGPKIVAFYKKHGYDTRDLEGLFYKNNGNTYYYYGLFDNYFSNHDKYQVDKRNLRVLDISIIDETIDIWI